MSSDTTTKTQTVLEQMQHAMDLIICSPISAFQQVLERIGPDSPDAPAIQSAIDQLEEIAGEITHIERKLANDTAWTFGKLNEV
jgi:hypothetical protein